MANEIVTLVKLYTVHLYLDLKKKIMYFDVINSTYSKQNSITVLQYFKNFWILAKEQNAQYYLVIKINSIGIYPLSFYNNLIDCLKELNEILKEHLHSCCFLCKDSNLLTMMKPLFTLYNFVRPYTICNTHEEVLIYFNKLENKLS
jgi:hypothetical protein